MTNWEKNILNSQHIQRANLSNIKTPTIKERPTKENGLRDTGISRKETQKDLKHMKRCSTSLTLKEANKNNTEIPFFT